MIRVTVELISARGREHDKILGRAFISNVGGTKTKGKYRYEIFGKNDKKLHEGGISDVPRKVFLAWDTLLACLLDARGDAMLKKIGR